MCSSNLTNPNVNLFKILSELSLIILMYKLIYQLFLKDDAVKLGYSYLILHLVGY